MEEALARTATEGLVRLIGFHFAWSLADEHQARMDIARKDGRALNRIACQGAPLAGFDLLLKLG
jgi:hypothetical protein